MEKFIPWRTFLINKLQSRSGRVLTVCGVLILSAALHLFFVFYFGDVDFEADSYLHFIYTASTFADLPKSLNYAAGVWPKPLFTLLTGLLDG